MSSKNKSNETTAKKTLRQKRDREFIKFDINQATKEQLSEISGISSDLAQAIVEYRKKYGFFKTFENLKSVHGIGDKKLNVLKEHCIIKEIKEEPSDALSKPKSSFLDLPLHAEQLVPKNYKCSYISDTQYQNLKVKSGLMVFLHVNIRSLRRNFKDLKNLVLSCKHLPDIICVSEAKNPKVEEGVALPSYSFRQAKSKAVSGGVALYVNEEKLSCIERKDLAFDIADCENVWVEITRKKEKNKIVVGVVYRHPAFDNLPKFIEELKKVIKKIKGSLFYILGDMNLNLLSSEKKIQDYCDNLMHCGCKLLINKPTRVDRTRTSTQTLIDHIYTNDQIREGSESGIIETRIISDHYPIYCIT